MAPANPENSAAGPAGDWHRQVRRHLTRLAEESAVETAFERLMPALESSLLGRAHAGLDASSATGDALALLVALHVMVDARTLELNSLAWRLALGQRRLCIASANVTVDNSASGNSSNDWAHVDGRSDEAGDVHVGGRGGRGGEDNVRGEVVNDTRRNGDDAQPQSHGVVARDDYASVSDYATAKAQHCNERGAGVCRAVEGRA